MFRTHSGNWWTFMHWINLRLHLHVKTEWWLLFITGFVLFGWCVILWTFIASFGARINAAKCAVLTVVTDRHQNEYVDYRKLWTRENNSLITWRPSTVLSFPVMTYDVLMETLNLTLAQSLPINTFEGLRERTEHLDIFLFSVQHSMVFDFWSSVY